MTKNTALGTLLIGLAVFLIVMMAILFPPTPKYDFFLFVISCLIGHFFVKIYHFYSKK